MENERKFDNSYKEWLAMIKNEFRSAQLKASISVNSEMLLFYWKLGRDIVEKQKLANWGDKILVQLSADLQKEFPEVKGFSLRNVKYMRQWFLFYNQDITFYQGLDAQIGQQPVAQFRTKQQYPFLSLITSIPWGHNIVILTKCSNINQALYYVQETQKSNWSRDVLRHQIESSLFEREGKAITNFKTTLPKPLSDLAQQSLKDPYIFDFFTLSMEYTERELEKHLISHISNFLLELGAGFAFIGKQKSLQVGEREFFIDLLFYHTRLHCYVVVELKTGDFEPEHVGKLNFYIKAIDQQLRNEKDEPTIGIIICKGKDKLVAEYALSDINKPIGVSEYKLTQALPQNLTGYLPSIEEIENELKNDNNHYPH